MSLEKIEAYRAYGKLSGNWFSSRISKFLTNLVTASFFPIFERNTASIIWKNRQNWLRQNLFVCCLALRQFFLSNFKMTTCDGTCDGALIPTWLISDCVLVQPCPDSNRRLEFRVPAAYLAPTRLSLRRGQLRRSEPCPGHHANWRQNPYFQVREMLVKY